MTRPNPHIALIYHYDLARALAGEVVDWQAIPVNVDAGREGGDLCRAAADFAKRRDLFAMPAPTDVSGNRTTAPACEPAEPNGRPKVEGVGGAAHPDTPPADRDRLRARIADLISVAPMAEGRLRIHWPIDVPTLRHEGHTDDELEAILAAVRRVETEVGAGWHPDDGVEPRSRQAIERALKAWEGRDPGTAWFAASLIATFEQCRNADSTFEELVAQFSISQADRLYEAASNPTE